MSTTTPTDADYARAQALLTPLSSGYQCRVCGLRGVDIGHALIHAQQGE